MKSPSHVSPNAPGKLCHRMLLALFTATALTSCSPQFQSKAAPAVTFMTIKGETITTQSLRGKVVLVNFWATDCPVCIREMPQLMQTHRKFQSRDYETVAVAMWHDPPNRVLDYAGRQALPFKVSFDPVGEIGKAFGDVKLTPTTFVIDKRGNIVERILGEPNFGKLEALIEAKLGETR